MRRSVRRLALGGTVLGLVAASSAPTAAGAPIVGQVDNFQTLDPMDWSGGVGGDNEQILAGGPGGMSDDYLDLQSQPGQQGSKLASINTDARWTGDYFHAGVDTLTMDLLSPTSNVTASNSLQIRVLLYSTDLGSKFISAAANIPNDGAWHHAVFSLAPATMTEIGTASYQSVITNVGRLQFRYDITGTTSGGTTFTGELGVDNIAAASSVPEPSAITLALAGGVAMLSRRRPRKAEDR